MFYDPMKQIFKQIAFLHYKVMCATDNWRPVPKPHHSPDLQVQNTKVARRPQHQLSLAWMIPQTPSRSNILSIPKC